MIPCGRWSDKQRGENRNPAAPSWDSQTVRTSEQGGAGGYDGAKKVCGRKRHLLVDTLGWGLLVVITAANVQDRHAACTLLTALATRFRRLRVIWAYGAYAGCLPVLMPVVYRNGFGGYGSGAKYGRRS